MVIFKEHLVTSQERRYDPGYKNKLQYQSLTYGGETWTLTDHVSGMNDKFQGAKTNVQASSN